MWFLDAFIDSIEQHNTKFREFLIRSVNILGKATEMIVRFNEKCKIVVEFT